MTRTGDAAVDWALREANKHSRDWYRMCKMFTRMAFDVPSDGTPDAGKAWDRARFKHMETDPMRIPAGVPVFWELTSVADHVAVSIGNGQCVSTDWPSHDVGIVDIAQLSRSWNGILLGWTEDIDSVPVYSPPPPPAPPKNLVQQARRDVHRAVAKLEQAIENGRGKHVEEFRRDLRQALRNNIKK